MVRFAKRLVTLTQLSYMKVLCVDPDLHLAFSSLFITKFITDDGGFTVQVNYNIVHLSLLPGAIFDMEHIWVHKTTICTLCWYHKVTDRMPTHL